MLLALLAFEVALTAAPLPSPAPAPAAFVVTLPDRRHPAAQRSRALQALADTGLAVVGAFDGDRLLVTAAAKPSIRGCAVSPLAPDDKLPPDARWDGAVVVHPLPGVRPADLATELRARGLDGPIEVHARFVVVADGSSETLRESLARDAHVLAVVPLPRAALPAGAESWGVLQSGVAGVTPLHAQGLAGQGEIVAVADSGLAPGCAFDDAAQTYAQETVDPAAPPPVPMTSPAHRKIQAYQALSFTNFTDESDTGGSGYHGTAVCGVVAGDSPPLAEQVTAPPDALPAQSNANDFDGQSPAARLVVQDVHLSGPDYDLPADLAAFIDTAWRAGARAWNASFSTTADGAYDHFSREIDVATHDRPDLVATIAAGNIVPRGSPGTVTAPSTSRNGLSVGNSSTGQYIEDLAPTSAWGPAADGRRKPDLVAPGSGIVLADGGAACDSQQLSGTSLSAPAVAAAAALVRQYFREGREAGGFPLSAPPRSPSAALVRATLALGTRSLLGGPQMTIIEQPTPSPEQGWGRVVLAGALSLPGDRRSLVVHADDDVASTTDGFPAGALLPDTFPLTVLSGADPLVVALSFTDVPPLPAAMSPVVNDLDLEVVAPSGATYLGGVFNAGWSVTGGTADALDNLELVRVPPPVETGTWTLRVRPASVVMGPQPYALVSTGDTCRPIGAFSTAPVVAEARCGGLVVSAPSIGGTPPVIYALFRGTTPGGEDFGNPIATGLARAAFPDVPPGGGTYYYVFEATDSCGARVRSAESSGGLSLPCPGATPLLFVTKSAVGLRLTWGDVGVSHDVRRHLAPSAVRAAAVDATSSTGEHEEAVPVGRLVCYVVD